MPLFMERALAKIERLYYNNFAAVIGFLAVFSFAPLEPNIPQYL
jgi:hypothetical protein